MAVPEAFLDHLKTGATHVCRCWAVTRKDGVVLGFTDHDQMLEFDETAFLPNSGMTARALEQTTGLSVDNSEALGILNDEAVNEADIIAGRFDGAEVRAWYVNWSDVTQRTLQFRGSIGEIQRKNGTFQAELRGLTEALNQPQGRVYQRPCSAVLGDQSCQFDLNTLGYSATATIASEEDQKFFTFTGLDGFEGRWFERGRLIVESGNSVGLVGVIKNDRMEDGVRRVELWEALRSPIAAGDQVRLEAGCDRNWETCKLKFGNLINFQGFPTIPGEDWLMSVPKSDSANDGGSLFQ